MCLHWRSLRGLGQGKWRIPGQGQRGMALPIIVSIEWVVPLCKRDSGTLEMHLEPFVSIPSYVLKSNDMSTPLENPSAQPQAYKKGWECERELTFQYHFFQNVHEVLLGNATQGCELWLRYQFQQLWIKIEVARLRLQRYFSPLIFTSESHDTSIETDGER